MVAGAPPPRAAAPARGVAASRAGAWAGRPTGAHVRYPGPLPPAPLTAAAHGRHWPRRARGGRDAARPARRAAGGGSGGPPAGAGGGGAGAQGGGRHPGPGAGMAMGWGGGPGAVAEVVVGLEAGPKFGAGCGVWRRGRGACPLGIAAYPQPNLKSLPAGGGENWRGGGE